MTKIYKIQLCCECVFPAPDLKAMLVESIMHIQRASYKSNNLLVVTSNPPKICYISTEPEFQSESYLAEIIRECLLLCKICLIHRRSTCLYCFHEICDRQFRLQQFISIDCKPTLLDCCRITWRARCPARFRLARDPDLHA